MICKQLYQLPSKIFKALKRIAEEKKLGRKIFKKVKMCVNT